MRFSLILLLCGLAFPNFKIDKIQSSISYTGSHPFHNWRGNTSQIKIITSCEIVSSDCDVTISVPVLSFMSGNDNRDSNMLFYVDAFSYPLVEISFSHLNILDLISRGESVNCDGEINFHGFKLIQKIPLFITKAKDTIFISSSFSIKLDSFGIDQPSLLMLPIKNEIKIDANLSGEYTR